MKAPMQHFPIVTAATSLTSNRTDKSDYRSTKAVIFDMSGVLFPSPLPNVFAYEQRKLLPKGTILGAVMKYGEKGAWQRLERGEFKPEMFGRLFSAECSEQLGRPVDMSDFFVSVFGYAFEARPGLCFPEIMDAIKCLKAEGIKVALLTNNSYLEDGSTVLPLSNDEKNLFCLIAESCKLKMNKPDHRIFHYVLEKLECKPEEAIFLDDLAGNIKAASEVGLRTIEVDQPKEAIDSLEKEVGIELRGYVEGTIAVPKHLRIDKEAVRNYLNATLGMNSPDPPIIRCFEHGQSNPTYFVRHGGRNLVLRKKPTGKLLPSAHAVDREYRVMKAVAEQGVPVPQMLAFCDDPSVVGTPFFVMEHVPGRVFKEVTLPDMTSEERSRIYSAMCEVLAKIHRVDIRKANLDDYGKTGEYVRRNFERWTRQYEASKTHDIPTMDSLGKWLAERLPTTETSTVVHGDFRLDNLIFHPDKLEVVAVIDWELSTLGDPLTDLATNCITYYVPSGLPLITGFNDVDIRSLGIPDMQSYVDEYRRLRQIDPIPNLDFYILFVCYRFCAILQGVYKRAKEGQASTLSESAEGAGFLAKTFSDIGWEIASKSSIPPTTTFNDKLKPTSNSTTNRHYSNVTSTESDMSHVGSLPLSVEGLSPKVQDLHRRVKAFIKENVIPIEKEVHEWSLDPKTKWTIHPKIEQLKVKGKSQGLWNLFLPKDSDDKLGAGLTNLEYAFICEELGKYPMASEAFNCSAPDTGNMEVLARYGSEAQKERWLKPLLNGEIRSCFGMTEPAVASSDATNIQATVKRQGDSYVIDGHKWWTSGAMDPRCKVCIFMGKTNPDAPLHQQQSMILVPMDAPGVKIVRPLTVFGYDDAPHGHAEVLFQNVRVPVTNIIYGEGRGFEIAQGRLGPGRIHHCMRSIGAAERALQLMVHRVQNRVAFGKPISSYTTIQHDIAQSRIEIEQCRLLVLKTALLMDTVGNKVAAPEIAMIKVAVPNMTYKVVDRAIQAHGGMGVCQDTTLASQLAWSRVLKIADGPDEVHLSAIYKMELRRQSHLAKL